MLLMNGCEKDNLSAKWNVYCRKTKEKDNDQLGFCVSKTVKTTKIRR